VLGDTPTPAITITGLTPPPLTAFNTAIGQDAGLHLVEGSYNTLIGAGAGIQLRKGSHNLFLGAGAGRDIITASNCVILGDAPGVGKFQDTDLEALLTRVGTPIEATQLLIHELHQSLRSLR
jgi:hypothetical protein